MIEARVKCDSCGDWHVDIKSFFIVDVSDVEVQRDELQLSIENGNSYLTQLWCFDCLEKAGLVKEKQT